MSSLVPESYGLARPSPSVLSSGDKPITICLIGLGRAGQFHMSAIRDLGAKNCVLKYVVDIQEEVVKKYAEETGAEGLVGDYSKAFADPEVDAVIVASTTYMHFEHIMGALQSNKAVLTEKPISQKPEEIEKVIQTAQEKKLPFRVSFQRRCDPNFQVLKMQVEKGVVGKPRVINITSRDNPEPPIEYLKVSGGIFHDMLCHDFDMIHFLTGEFPDKVFSVGHAYNPEIEQMDDCDTAIVTLHFPSGLLATVNTSRICPYGYDQRVEVFGEKGSVWAQNKAEADVMVGTIAGFQQPRVEWSFPQRYPQAYLENEVQFLQLVKDWRQEDEKTVLRHVMLEKVATAAEISWKEGRPVELKELD